MQWAANAAAPGEQLGVRCLAQGSHLSRGIEGGENACYSPTIPPRVTSPTLYPLGMTVHLNLDCLPNLGDGE